MTERIRSWYDPRTWGKSKARAYEGADNGRFTMNWKAFSTSADTEIYSSLPRLRDRGRQLDRDNPWAAGSRKTIVNNVIGRPGIQPRAQLRKGTGPQAPLDEDSNWRIENEFWRWSKAANCDANGRLSLVQLQRLMLSTWFPGGEVLIRKISGYRPKARVDLQIQLLEGDFLDHTFNRAKSDTEAAIVAGVEKNGFGRPLAYHIFKNHPGDWHPTAGHSRERVRVPASEMIHLFIPSRAGQTRGVPEAAAVMRRLHDMNTYEEAERVAATVTAQKLGFFYVEDGEYAAPKPGEPAPKFSGKAGTFTALPEGMRFEGWDPQHPVAAYEAFTLSMLRGIAAGLDLSYESVTRDYSRTSYSSARTAQLAERELYRILQDWVADLVMTRIFEWWIDAAHMGANGAFVAKPIPQYITDKEGLIDAVAWRGRGWPWVDPLKEIQAKKEELKAGLTTYSKIFAEQGMDFEETMREIEGERKYMASLGLKFDIETTPQIQKAVDDHTAETDKEDEKLLKKANGKSHPADWSLQ